MEDKFSVANESGIKIPALPLRRIKNDILGSSYNLSIAFVDEARSRQLNRIYRRKDNPTNVLSFSLSESDGELVLCPAIATKEAKNFSRSFPNFLGFLVIHGMLHLKGHVHSSKMEEAEEKYDQKYFHRNRRRVGNNPGGGRRIHQRGKKS